MQVHCGSIQPTLDGYSQPKPPLVVPPVPGLDPSISHGRTTDVSLSFGITSYFRPQPSPSSRIISALPLIWSTSAITFASSILVNTYSSRATKTQQCALPFQSKTRVLVRNHHQACNKATS